MAWTTPLTMTTSHVVTAAEWNEQIRDNELFLYNRPAVRFYNTTAQVFANTNTTTFQFQTSVERWDTDSMHSTVTNPSRITFNTAGLYHVGAVVEWGADADGERAAEIILNGTTTIVSELNDAAPATVHRNNPTTTWKFAANDYIELLGYQSSGGNLQVTGGTSTVAYVHEFWATWAGSGTA